MGLAVASQYVGFQRELRATNETADNATEYVNLFLYQARVTALSSNSESRSTVLAALGGVIGVPGILWWYGRLAYWGLIELSADPLTTFWLLFGGVIVSVPFAVLSMSIGIPLCVGLAVYVDTVFRVFQVLFDRGQ